MYKMQIVSTVSNEPSQRNRYRGKLTKINRLIYYIHNFLANNGGNLIEFHMEKRYQPHEPRTCCNFRRSIILPDIGVWPLELFVVVVFFSIIVVSVFVITTLRTSNSNKYLKWVHRTKCAQQLYVYQNLSHVHNRA